ncbi:MAG TPA: hypothetical protein VJ746_11815 [Nitrospira sp.]|nr:hypothetical protein [Nitrospira sp.]
MRKLSPFGLMLCLCLSIASPQATSGSGVLQQPDEHGCSDAGDPKNVTFTPTRFTYVFAGTCTLTQTRGNLDVTVPWTGVGTYDPPTGRTAEDIIVPAPRIDQPSRPYGRFQATMHCSRDPWLNPDIKCDRIAPTVYAPLDNTAPNTMGWKQPYPLAPIITSTIQQNGRPYTAMNMNQGVVNKLNQQYGAYLAQQQAERQNQKFQHELQMKPGIIRPRGIEGEQPDEPPSGAPGLSEEPGDKKSE